MKQKHAEYSSKLSNLILGGLIGISIIILQDWISLKALDFPAQVSEIAFAVSLPMLSFSLLIRQLPRSEGEGSRRYKAMGWVMIIGILVDLLGIFFAFSYISWIAGIVLFLVGIIVFFIYIEVESSI